LLKRTDSDPQSYGMQRDPYASTYQREDHAEEMRDAYAILLAPRDSEILRN